MMVDPAGWVLVVACDRAGGEETKIEIYRFATHAAAMKAKTFIDEHVTVCTILIDDDADAQTIFDERLKIASARHAKKI